MIAIVDSFAWIEFLAGSRNEDKIRTTLAKADVVVTPDIVLAEVARKLLRDNVGAEEVRRKLLDMATLSEIAPITVEVALGVFDAEVDLRRSAKMRRRDTPGLSDSVILSVARARGGVVLTGDPHFRGLPETLWLDP